MSIDAARGSGARPTIGAEPTSTRTPAPNPATSQTASPQPAPAQAQPLDRFAEQRSRPSSGTNLEPSTGEAAVPERTPSAASLFGMRRRPEDEGSNGRRGDDSASAASANPAPAAPKGAELLPTYVVAAGDNLGKIAKAHGTSVPLVADANGIENPNLIRVGQELTIPVYTVRPGDTLSKIAKDFDTTVDAMVELNELPDANRLGVGQKLQVPMRPVEQKPVDPVFDEQVINGVTLRNYGASPEALAEAERIIETLVIRPDVQQQLEERQVTVVIVPHDKKLTEMPEFASLKGQTTFDGRSWDTVRGVANVYMDGGGVAISMPEENLANMPSDEWNGSFSTGIHEMAHGVHLQGLPWEEVSAITEAYDARVATDGPWTDYYAASNENEYFAQASTAYFSQNSGMGENGPEWLAKNDPTIYAILEQTYGPPAAAVS